MDWEKIIMETYTELYKNSEPSANFQELMDTSPKNELGQIDIPFMDYEIEESKLKEILESISKKYKLKGYKKDSFYSSILLGCSPKFKAQ